MSMNRLLLSALLLLAGSAWAGPYEDAEAAHNRGDYAAELKITRPLAAKGEAWAQYYLGQSYRSGRGVPQNYRDAAKWYRLAAAQGDAVAQRYLGWMYLDGKGVAQDYAEAVKWFRLAAAQGAVSQSQLKV